MRKRGCWLAAQNDAWDYTAASQEEAGWQTGSRDARLALLRRLRAEDPGRGRELLAATWNEEGPEDRARFLALLDVLSG